MSREGEGGHLMVYAVGNESGIIHAVEPGKEPNGSFCSD